MSRLFEAVLENPITLSFAAIIALVLAFAFVALAGRRAGAAAFVASAPSILTSIGVLGTLSGIFAGLLGFDVTDIDACIGDLLEGLKAAFVTSILGMAAAIFLKVFQAVVYTDAEPGEVTPAHIHAILAELRDRSVEGFERQAAEYHNLAEHMASIPSHLRKLAKVVRGMSRRTEKLEGYLEEAMGLRGKTVEAPAAVERAVSAVENAFDAHEKSLGELIDGFGHLKEGTKFTVDMLAKDIEQTVTTVSERLTGMAEQQAKASARMQAGMEHALTRTSTVLDQRIVELDRQMQEEVGRVVETMGGHLASLSGKLVADYGPLTDKLRQMVELGRGE